MPPPSGWAPESLAMKFGTNMALDSCLLFSIVWLQLCNPDPTSNPNIPHISSNLTTFLIIPHLQSSRVTETHMVLTVGDEMHLELKGLQTRKPRSVCVLRHVWKTGLQPTHFLCSLSLFLSHLCDSNSICLTGLLRMHNDRAPHIGPAVALHAKSNQTVYENQPLSPSLVKSVYFKYITKCHWY